MSRIYHDADADLGALRDRTLAVVGYGNQGRSQALNLRDSGLNVIVGNIVDASLESARADDFEALPIADACARADVVLLLVPDEVMPEVYQKEVAPQLRPDSVLDFASGYNIAFGLITPPDFIDVVLVAPRMIGPGVRDTYVSGEGFPSFVGVHQDASGKAGERMLALGKGIGSTRAGCIEMSMHDEASLDLFTEQGFGPAFGNVMMAAVDTLVEAGYPPEAVLLELFLSGELAYTFQKIREVGMLAQMDFHSHTSQYGSMTRGARFVELVPDLKEKMKETLEEIRSGRFSQEWSTDHDEKLKLLERLKEVRAKIPFADYERRARAAFRIGSRDEDS
ncbi:MAG: ketol-acid reductoisomerase [Deltaproteobacteria bacterium]|nr:ketol-acid reductoisomerase [Deltaproteobacteria bacterium]